MSSELALYLLFVAGLLAALVCYELGRRRPTEHKHGNLCQNCAALLQDGYDRGYDQALAWAKAGFPVFSSLTRIDTSTMYSSTKVVIEPPPFVAVSNGKEWDSLPDKPLT